MSDAAQSERIRARRPQKPPVDPWRPLGSQVEEERGADGRMRDSLTVFLAGSECPFTCVFCDLWQYTLDQPTPPGAIPKQLEIVFESLGPDIVPDSIKLYNASNFFDRNAVPPQDLGEITDQLAGFRRVTVECHPRLVGESCFSFAENLEGELEVAMGLETIHPEASSRLNKQMTLSDFAQATRLLRVHGIGIRAFVLLSPPFVTQRESVEWTVRTVEFALEHDVGVVSVIPMRGGNGEMERLGELGLFEPPTLEMLEESMIRALGLSGGVVLADLWDVEALAACPICRDERLSHLREMNRMGTVGAAVDCPSCRVGERGDA